MRLRFTHRRFNDFLTVVVLMAGLYIVVVPFLPLAGSKLNPPEKASSLSDDHSDSVTGEALLKIPRLGLTEPINSGNTAAELNKGVWLIPNTSTPDKQSNTVMAGHRFTYAGPAVFYFLDRVQLDDAINVEWQQQAYIYRVKRIFEVPPTSVEIQQSTSKPTLTLYTCTPLLTAKNRLVVVAELETNR